MSTYSEAIIDSSVRIARCYQQNELASDDAETFTILT